MILLFGSGYNQLARAAAAPAPGSVWPGCSASALYDGLAEDPFIFDGAPYTLDFDLNQVPNGDFSTAFAGSLPSDTGWGKSSGAILTRDTSVYLSSPASLKVTGAGEYAYFDLEVAAGEVLTVSGAGHAAAIFGAPPGARLGCQNLETGTWLNTAGQWQPEQTHWADGQTAFALATLTFTVEDFATCKADRVVLRFRFVCQSPAPEAWFDDFFVWPRINFAFMHNHNFPSAVACGFRSSASGFAATTFRGRFSIAQPTMFLTTADVDERYWRFISSTPPDLRNLFMSQLVLGQYQNLSRNYMDGHVIGTVDPQDRSASNIGPSRAHLLTAHARRVVELQFRHPDGADFQEHAEVQERSRNGAHPLIVVLDPEDPASALMCQTPDAWKPAHRVGTSRQSSLQLDEFPFTIVAP